MVKVSNWSIKDNVMYADIDACDYREKLSVELNLSTDEMVVNGAASKYACLVAKKALFTVLSEFKSGNIPEGKEYKVVWW